MIRFSSNTADASQHHGTFMAELSLEVSSGTWKDGGGLSDPHTKFTSTFIGTGEV